MSSIYTDTLHIYDVYERFRLPACRVYIRLSDALIYHTLHTWHVLYIEGILTPLYITTQVCRLSEGLPYALTPYKYTTYMRDSDTLYTWHVVYIEDILMPLYITTQVCRVSEGLLYIPAPYTYTTYIRNTQTHTYTHAHTRMHAHTHTHTHTHAHTHTHTHTLIYI